MNVKINDLMVDQVICAEPHHTVEHVRGVMERNHIHAVPVAGPDGEPKGIVTTADLLKDPKGGAAVTQIMTEHVHTVPAYNDVHVAARIMRKNKVHHVVVTHEQKIVGILSSFDLLKLVEDHRFVMKNPPNAGDKK